jgi:hypothetical protein
LPKKIAGDRIFSHSANKKYTNISNIEGENELYSVSFGQMDARATRLSS